MANEEKEILVTVKWSGKDYQIANVKVTSTVGDLKTQIYQETGVQPERQKLLGLKCKGKRGGL